ncbi:MAG: homoaconitate hydratase family protein [Candidatus Aminicenantes bacterium]|nr:homoaconitate hydratase family protein [Candidatus Aminicenantes bacterium]
MKHTVIEKIFREHAEEEVKPGSIVWINLDVVSARDFGGPNVVKNYRKAYGSSQVFDAGKVFFTFDLTVPPKTIQYANNQQVCRDFAGEQGIKVYDVDQGIGTHTFIEQGFALPGTIVVGTDSHMNILGAVNCFGQGMGDVDITFGFRFGRTWFQVPETVKVVLKGKPQAAFSAKDLTLYILGVLKTGKLLGKAVEFYGPAVENLDLAGRITLLSMITEMGGIVGFIPFRGAAPPAHEGPENSTSNRRGKQARFSNKPPGSNNKDTAEELKQINGLSSLPAEVRADEGGHYAETIEIDVSGIGPMVSEPPYPHNVKKITEIEKVKVDFGFIGSCTNGRIEDLEAARRILKGKQLAPGVRLAVVPATRAVYYEAMERGILFDLLKAGAIISNPGCGGCAQGHIGMTGKGEVMVSTGNRNFPGKQGDGQNYLTSPEVVAYSVLKGYLSAPPE